MAAWWAVRVRCFFPSFFTFFSFSPVRYPSTRRLPPVRYQYTIRLRRLAGPSMTSSLRAGTIPPLRLSTASAPPPTLLPGPCLRHRNFTSPPRATASPPTRPGPSRRTRASFLFLPAAPNRTAPHRAPRRSSSPIPDAVESDAARAHARAIFL
ncbi:hypothetical protein HYPSUDRAFT_816161 [Hypholoma sublateritium FD-334 SS-4]|uniref:Uncharacterized protein n=1 Tax=Hypholoma sublateritium (strain FD-334 SS-4) TaxID=945553 RepID=A0A0D2NNA4_HYPSF|nr:hypothetical protein HYPSUDRAFT_816161 [Hypholoma sublateritium FD-334 SS-4]